MSEMSEFPANTTGGKHTGCQILTGTKDFTAANYGWKSVSLTLPAKTSKVQLIINVCDCLGQPLLLYSRFSLW